MKMKQEGTVLLGLLPFWTPLIPPMGIACLKSFLRRHGYPAVTFDANIEDPFKEIYDEYFDILRKNVPEEKRGNFYSIGQAVLHNHLVTHLNHKDGKAYVELAKILVSKTYFCDIGDDAVDRLNQTVREFYSCLETYIAGVLEEVKPAVLGLSVCSGTLAASLFVFKWTRQRYPHIKTVMGGGIFCDQLAVGTPNFNLFLEETRPYIDKVIVGEGELLLLKLLQGELPGSVRVHTREDIGGELLDIASADVPGFTDFKLHHYPYLSAYTSRSCPNRCKFCSDTVMWGKYRKKSAARVVEEMTQLYETFNHQLFLLSDLLLNPIVTELAAAFSASGPALYWDGCLRAEKPVCDPDNTLLWRRGGFYRARIGCESGSQRVLELMGKRITVEQIKTAVSSLASAGIQVTTYWVIGFPGETETDFQQTLDIIEELREDIYEAECRPFYYYLSGQVNSREWAEKNRVISLYPEYAKDMLLFPTLIMDCSPSREVTYQRVGRFVRRCRGLGIPNPYTLQEINEADRRWQKLHRNAVPALLELKNKTVYVDECKQVEKLVAINTVQVRQDDK
jgi:hypothetical protein